MLTDDSIVVWKSLSLVKRRHVTSSQWQKTDLYLHLFIQQIHSLLVNL